MRYCCSALLLLSLSSAAWGAVLELHADPTPPPFSAPCSAELYKPGGVCYRVASTKQFVCLAAHRSVISAACQQLLKNGGH
jgi:hypothetical protein